MMTDIHVDLSRHLGAVKPMNAVNNGPAGSRARQTGNFPYYEALNIPYARLHDASFYAGNYGGEFSVDVHRVFPDFSKDENDPASYRFAPTDSYLEDIASVGTEAYYRLGASIEHEYKYGTYPPADFAKWARICEHIIRHYTEGWADGYRHKITYWEIWNEPDCCNPDGSNPCWQGTDEQFYDFFETAVKHLKGCFPELKIGGPALAGPDNRERCRALVKQIKERNIPIDFYSFHWYGSRPADFCETVYGIVSDLKLYGIEGVELHLNEWNYVKSWVGQGYIEGMVDKFTAIGSSFVSSIMSVAHKTPLDMLMFYDARPGQWCSLFEFMTHRRMKPYYSFLAYRTLAELGTCVYSEDKDDFYSLAAVGEDGAAVIVSRYNDNKEAEPATVKLELKGLTDGTPVKVEYLLLDADHDLEPVREEYFTATNAAAYIKMPNHTVYLIKITKC